MNSKGTFLITVLAAVLCINCSQKTTQQITNTNDYNAYLAITKNKTLDRAKQNEVFCLKN
jgi:hypothetical protein